MTSNDYTFASAKEIVKKDSEFIMVSLDADSLFINISREETIDISALISTESTEKVEGLSK